MIGDVAISCQNNKLKTVQTDNRYCICVNGRGARCSFTKLFLVSPPLNARNVPRPKQ